MDSPFYRSSWGSSPRYPANFRGATPSRKPKVVSIPVQFVQPESENCCKLNPGSMSKSRSECAVKIQKLWRGFRIRKNVRKLLAIQRELDQVDKSILEKKTVEAIRRDERERLRVSEGLMSLLLKLDSVGGFDGAVRELRRTITRRAVMLQEKVDSITAGADADQAEISTEEPLETECENRELEGDCGPKLCEEVEENRGDPDLHLALSEKPDPETEEPHPDPEPCSASPIVAEVKSEGSLVEKMEEEESGPVEREIGVVQEEKSSVTEEGKRCRGMLEKMVEENSKLMALMADLFDKNEMQTQILSSLSQRVEQLENAFACEKLRRAKKLKKSRHPQYFGKKAN